MPACRVPGGCLHLVDTGFRAGRLLGGFLHLPDIYDMTHGGFHGQPQPGCAQLAGLVLSKRHAILLLMLLQAAALLAASWDSHNKKIS